MNGYFTPREAQVVALVAEGKSNKEIAKQLGNSPSTIRTVLRYCFLRNGLRSRTEAAMELKRRGVVPPKDASSHPPYSGHFCTACGASIESADETLKMRGAREAA